ncbi:MAG TPA: aspartyl/asparaginyl beta-hydroxylase domain-containing protein [Opitutus sp.]|nr:aspartyl/asparaginyl beta-hydroxylase domain-containing protein [Opitutus sp.]
MQPSVRLSVTFDPARLQADLDRIVATDFVPHFNTRYYQGDWSVVPLRSIGGRADQIFPDPSRKNDFADTLLLERCPYFREVLAYFRCPQQAVRLLRLKAGSIIKEHSDYDLGFEDGEVRLHIPVRTNPDLIFLLDGRRVIMREGECWYNNLSLRHSVENHGSTERVHLVIDCVVNDWLRERLLADSALAAAAVPPA